MRTYKCDSPQAAARLVALCLLADSHVSSNELDALEEAGLSEKFGLAPGEFQSVMQGLCEDLTLSAHMDWGQLCAPNSELTQQLVAELKNPRMRDDVMRLCKIAAQADNHVSEGESAVLSAYARAWQLPAGWDVICRKCAEASASGAN